MLNIAVFGSGRGSNFIAILDAMQSGSIPNARLRVVLSNNPDAGILRTAASSSIPALHLSQRQFRTEEEFAARLLSVMNEYGVNFIVLAGYVKRLPSSVVGVFRNRIVNIHPALLPKYGGAGMYGMHVHEAVIASGDRVSGATVHLVDEEYDRGAVVLQREIEVMRGETAESLAARVLEVEHELYPEVIRLFSEGRVVTTEDEVAVHPS